MANGDVVPFLTDAQVASPAETHAGSKLRQNPVSRLARLSGLTGATE
jgi:hypothetical protein